MLAVPISTFMSVLRSKQNCANMWPHRAPSMAAVSSTTTLFFTDDLYFVHRGVNKMKNMCSDKINV